MGNIVLSIHILERVTCNLNVPRIRRIGAVVTLQLIFQNIERLWLHYGLRFCVKWNEQTIIDRLPVEVPPG